MLCKNCGSELPDSAKFCSKCGSSQKPSDTASKQLNDYSEALYHIYNVNNINNATKNLEEQICATIGGVILLIFILITGLSLISIIIGSIIGMLIGWPISKVIGFFYKTLGFDKSNKNWKSEPTYIKVRNMIEKICFEVMGMSTSEYYNKPNILGRSRVPQLKECSELKSIVQKNPKISLEEAITQFYKSQLIEDENRNEKRTKTDNLQISSSSPMTIYKKLTYNRTMSNKERKYYYQFMTFFTDVKLIKIVVALGRIITTRYYEYYLEDFHESYKNKEKELLSLEGETLRFYQKIIAGELSIEKFMDNYFNNLYKKLEKLAPLISDWMDMDKERMSFEIKKENFEFYGMIVNELIEPIEAINVNYRFIDDIFETTQYFFAVENNIESLKNRYNVLCKLLDCPENKDRVQMVSDIDAEYKMLNKKLFGKEAEIMVHKF